MMYNDNEIKDFLMNLYDRPQEYCFMPKGVSKTSVFQLPKSYTLPEFGDMTMDLESRFGEDTTNVISVPEVPIPPLGEIVSIPRDENFSIMIPKHRKIAGKLIDIFLGVPNVRDLLSIAVYIRDRVNPYLFNYAFSVALLHRKDTQDIDIPSFIRSFPDKYVDSKVFSKAREKASIVPEGSRTPIEIPKDFTATDLEEEHRLYYFREDLGINLHHWHWHLVYPNYGALQVVKKDRRGELFYYMHQQVIARYNFERFCNNLKRVERLLNFDEPIKEGYFSKLDSLVASTSYPPRIANQKLSNVKRPAEGIEASLSDLKIWINRIYDGINSGYIKSENNEMIPLTEFEGIDILGDLIESSTLSKNSTYYGDLHNMGHVVLAYIHDPENKHLESFNVIADTATAMRDPVFYRWHAFIDDIFQNFKSTLPRYTVQQLNYPGISIENCFIERSGEQNVIKTFWQQADVDLSRGMDFQPRGPVYIRFTHLNHLNYDYKIIVNNNSGSNRMGTVRIFLSPKYDEAGNSWLFRDQKTKFIELDKFRVILKQGQTTISRASTQSSVTIPFERTFRDLNASSSLKRDELEQFNFCGCGWPHHMLIPKGRTGGMECLLFVMISNYDLDKVEQDETGVCNDADSYCGIKDKKYPDRRSMGYPFDREARDGVSILNEFLTPNMSVTDCKIVFLDKTFKPGENK